MSDYWLKIKPYWILLREFLRRWWIWISAGIGIVYGLSAIRRANIKADKANQVVQDAGEDEITTGWNVVEDATDKFFAAQKKAKQVKENANKQLDRIATTDASVSDLISDWNAANRLSDDQGVT